MSAPAALKPVAPPVSRETAEAPPTVYAAAASVVELAEVAVVAAEEQEGLKHY